MDNEALNETIESYKNQLIQINSAISASTNQEEITGLISLKKDIQQLLSLTEENLEEDKNGLEDEYAQFMAEMEKEGAYGSTSKESTNAIIDDNAIKSLEGTMCKAPHEHNWGETIYHNAMICSVISQGTDDIQVKVMFTNPTHSDMLPCPYFLETECKFSEEQCRYSHGEIIQYSSLKEYVKPVFESVGVGTKVLAKKGDKLWHRGTVKHVVDQRYLIKFDSQSKDLDLELKDILPLDNETEDSSSDSESERNVEDVINMSLMITPASQALGDWEKHTKGIGSRLMEKMGYVIGTGLGKESNGRLEPVTAVILPPGKSLDHCMDLREKAGGDKNLFSVERKLKRQQKRQEIRNQKAYEREKKKVDVFNFLNDTLALRKSDSIWEERSKHRHEIKGESSRNLNVASLRIEEDIKKIEKDLYRIREGLKRHQINSAVHKSLKMQQHNKEHELKLMQERSVNIKAEQSVRTDKKKLTIF